MGRARGGAVLEELARYVMRTAPGRRALVAIDGVDGGGKTTFTSALAELCTDRPVVVLHVDGFLNPAFTRHARGRWSPEGHWLDLYDYDAFLSRALNPLRPGGDGWYRPASFDPGTDSTLSVDAVYAPENAVVLVEGLFLHRDELVDAWDLSIFLDVPFEEMVRRLSERDGIHADIDHETTQRYVGGQRLYFELAKPRERATIVVDNSDPTNPRVVSGAQPSRESPSSEPI